MVCYVLTRGYGLDTSGLSPGTLGFETAPLGSHPPSDIGSILCNLLLALAAGMTSEFSGGTKGRHHMT